MKLPNALRDGRSARAGFTKLASAHALAHKLATFARALVGEVERQDRRWRWPLGQHASVSP
jgi:hypothetical protein